MKIKIIAHRGAFLPEGPIPIVQEKYVVVENSIKAFRRAFQNDWGIETDIRINLNGDYVVTHDENSKRLSRYEKDSVFKIPTLDELCQIASDEFVAFQIKRSSDAESGIKVGRAIAEKIKQYDLKNCIVFDATLKEAEILNQEFPWLNLSVSLGESNYSPTIYTPNQVLTEEFKLVYKSIWADEWKENGAIYNYKLLKELRNNFQGRIDIISPELHFNENHPLSKDLDKLKELWKKIIGFGTIDGICTDYPTTLASII